MHILPCTSDSFAYQPEGEKQTSFWDKNPFADKRFLVITGLVAAVAIKGLLVVSGCIIALSLLERAYRIWLMLEEKALMQKTSLSLLSTCLFLKPLIGRLRQCSKWNTHELDHRLALSTLDERKILAYLDHHLLLTPEIMNEIRCGAYVCLEDEGVTYDSWVKGLSKKCERASSHISHVKQFAVRGYLVNELIFGKKGKKTWFQLERSPCRFGYLTSHLYDFLVYTLTRKNVGPAGHSSYTEQNPLILKFSI